MVTMDVSASGMAATASATANISESRRLIFLNMHKPNTITQITIMSIASLPLNWSRLS